MDDTFRRHGIYHRRFQYWYPWGVTQPWLPRVFRGGDEWCNDSFCVVIPPLGCLVVFWRPGKLRTMPCAVEWAHMSKSERADYAPCGRYHNGKVDNSKHAHWDNWPCENALRWLRSGVPERVIAHEDAVLWRSPWEKRA